MLLSRFYPNQLDLYVKETMKKVLHEWTIFAGKSLGETIQEILSDLRNYFDKALSPKILFKNERKQYDEVSAKHIPPSVVNEADHFGYLFGRCFNRCDPDFVDCLLDLLTSVTKGLGRGIHRDSPSYQYIVYSSFSVSQCITEI
ncbi:protein MRG1-like isoform X1 [Apium graveolens]|uniref:protein MRG1-like isoform X1 n=1 Tax=Apium graveolens TaxID=4045 RepID=UPI003D7BD8D4